MYRSVVGMPAAWTAGRPRNEVPQVPLDAAACSQHKVIIRRTIGQSVCYRRDVEVAKKTAKRVKHVPQRTCVGCRQTLAKRSLIRIVRTPEGLRVDPTGKVAGRGAYLHDRRTCWERGLKGALGNALKIELSTEDRNRLVAYMGNLPEEPLIQNEQSNDTGG